MRFYGNNTHWVKCKVKLERKVGGFLSGCLIGMINGLLGAGGGLIAVPALKKAGLEQKQAHACSIAVILPLSAVSAGLYIWRGDVTVSDALPYLMPGAVGAVIGALLLGKVPDKWLRRIFGAFMVWAGIRLLMK